MKSFDFKTARQIADHLLSLGASVERTTLGTIGVVTRYKVEYRGTKRSFHDFDGAMIHLLSRLHRDLENEGEVIPVEFAEHLKGLHFDNWVCACRLIAKYT